MDKKEFLIALQKVLTRRYPLNVSSEWSRHTEGLLVSHEEQIPFQSVAFVLDSELDPEQAKEIVSLLCEYFSKDRMMKQSKYCLLVWSDNTFDQELYRKFGFRRIKPFSELFAQTDFKQNSSGDINNLAELSRKAPKIGQFICVTNASKLAELNSLSPFFKKRHILVYPTSEADGAVPIIRDLPCLGIDL